MIVKDLIAKLQEMPPDSEVWHLWDGELRTEINVVYHARNGCVVTADHGMVCYSTDSRPKDAPSQEEDSYWKTPDQ